MLVSSRLVVLLSLVMFFERGDWWSAGYTLTLAWVVFLPVCSIFTQLLIIFNYF